MKNTKELQQVQIKSVDANEKPAFIKTNLVTCERGGQEFKWETIETKDSVHVLLVDHSNEEIILVEQVRVPVLIKDDSQDGQVIEACAGLVDKDIPIEQIVKEEILEECGYDIPITSITAVKTLKSSVGTAGSNAHTFVANVSDKEKVSLGGGLPGEDINVIRISFEEAPHFFFNPNVHTDAVTMFLTMYWLQNN